MNQDESVFLNHHGILVTNSRIQIEEATYYIHNITSVKPKKIMAKRKIKKEREQMVFGILLAASVVLLFVGFIGDGLIFQALIGASVVGGFIAIIGLGDASSNYKRIPEYHVYITSAAGEVDAFWTEDADEAKALVTSINEAIASRA